MATSDITQKSFHTIDTKDYEHIAYEYCKANSLIRLVLENLNCEKMPDEHIGLTLALEIMQGAENDLSSALIWQHTARTA